MSTEPSRTHHANQAVAIGELLSLKFSNLNLYAKVPRTLKVMSPDGPSTDGGRKARQSLVLAPREGRGPNIVCGYVDTARHVAELRSFVVINKQNEDRYHEPLDFMRVEYDRFVQDIIAFLQSQGLQARISNEKLPSAPAQETPRAKPSDESTPMAMMLVLGFVLGLGTGYMIFEWM